MTKPSSLATLIDLTKDDANKAGKQIQAMLAERHKAAEQLSMLQEYRLDYAVRLQALSETGVSASNYHNFRQFIATLDEAISQQNRVLMQWDTKLEQGRQRWYAEKRRLSSYETLQARQRREQLAHENRREQLASDEIAANLYRRAHYTH